MIQTVVDNFDTDISSQNGKLSTHSLSILMTQPDVAEETTVTIETIKRVTLSEKSQPLEYKTEIKRYQGPKKPHMPEDKSKKHVLPLSVLAKKAVSRSHEQESDFAFLQAVLCTPKYPEYNGYNTRIATEQGHTVRCKTKADYLPLIDMKLSYPDTILTALDKCATSWRHAHADEFCRLCWNSYD